MLISIFSTGFYNSLGDKFTVGTKNTASAIENFVSPVAAETTQSTDQIRISLFSQALILQIL